jgi:predicted DNA-binding transcriptional regulator AlpA
MRLRAALQPALSVEDLGERPEAGLPAQSASILPPLLLRAAQAAAYCGVSEATWWRWDAAGKIPRGHKVSAGVKVWCRPELEEWAALGLPERAEFEGRRAAANANNRQR